MSTPLTLTIAAAADDITGRPSYSLLTPPELGNDGAACTAGFRFLSVAIPNGAVITSAHIHVRAGWNPGSFPIVNKIHCGAEDTCAAWVASTHDPCLISRTANYTDWSLASFTSGTWYESPDFASALQDVVVRPGWVSGNNLSVLICDNGSTGDYYTVIGDYADDPGYAAYVDLVYTGLTGLTVKHYVTG
jgi:hypothetical protein